MTGRISGIQPEPQARAHQDRHGYRPDDQTFHAQAKPEGPGVLALRPGFACGGIRRAAVRHQRSRVSVRFRWRCASRAGAYRHSRLHWAVRLIEGVSHLICNGPAHSPGHEITVPKGTNPLQWKENRSSRPMRQRIRRTATIVRSHQTAAVHDAYLVRYCSQLPHRQPEQPNSNAPVSHFSPAL